MTVYVVTVKLPRNEAHDPRNKVTAPCPLSGRECTDQTGEHHSVLVEAQSAIGARDYFIAAGVHVTRVEAVGDRYSTTVTNAMVNAAWDALPGDVKHGELDIEQLRAAITVALRARRSQT
jgi:hypothetical protein